MRKDDILDASNAYSYKLDLSKIKQDLSKASKKHKAPAKRYVCIDLEMTEFTASQGEGDIKTFCWSKSDFNQLWSELEAKGKHRYDLFATLQDFVDLQDIFGKLISSKTSVGLESAMRLLQMGYKGQVHTALSDSYNTARILHKLFCTESLEVDFEYINPSKETPANQKLDEEYNCSLASFLSPELLSQFGYTGATREEAEENSTVNIAEDLQLLEASPLAGLINNEEIANLCSKYNIEVQSWLKLATEVMNTQEMQVA